MKRIQILLVAALAAASLAFTTVSSAQTSAPAKKERKAGGTLSEGTYRQIERIQELIAKNQNADALAKANDLLGHLSAAYEKAIVYQTIGFIYATQNNYPKALASFEEALKLDALPQQPYEQLLFNTGQMYYAAGQTDTAIKRLEQYFAEAMNPPNADAHIMLASLYTEKKRFNEALPHVDTAISMVKQPKESWVQLRLALHYELKQIAACADDLLVLISMGPTKKEYWKQLSSVFLEIKHDPEALAVLALANRQGFLTEETEYRNLFSVYMVMDIPYKGAQILQLGLDRKVLKADEKTLTQLGDAWSMAREYDKAEAALRQAAGMSDRGDIYYRLAQIYAEDEQWKSVMEMADKALAKSVKDTGQALFLAGVAAYESGDPKRASGYLQRALQYDSVRSQSTQWLTHIRETEGASQALAAHAEAQAEAAKARKEEIKKY